jgi:hypothetical protein
MSGTGLSDKDLDTAAGGTWEDHVFAEAQMSPAQVLPT